MQEQLLRLRWAGAVTIALVGEVLPLVTVA